MIHRGSGYTTIQKLEATDYMVELSYLQENMKIAVLQINSRKMMILNKQKKRMGSW